MTNRKRISTPVIPLIQLYDTGTQTFTIAGEFHTWDSVAFKTSDFHYIEDDDRVFINVPSAGYYEITFECSFIKDDNIGVSSATSQVYKNGEAVTGAQAIGCSYETGQTKVSCACITLHFIIYLKAKDYIQIKTTASANNMLSECETSRLVIKFIPTDGWNNNSGGNKNYRGRIER